MRTQEQETSDRLRLARTLVVVVALAACVAGLFNDFARDDISLILDDQRVHTLSSWATFFASPNWPPPWAANLYRPLTTLMFAVESRCSTSPAG